VVGRFGLLLRDVIPKPHTLTSGARNLACTISNRPTTGGWHFAPLRTVYCLRFLEILSSPKTAQFPLTRSLQGKYIFAKLAGLSYSISYATGLHSGKYTSPNGAKHQFSCTHPWTSSCLCAETV
jgi:hypothetical protein